MEYHKYTYDSSLRQLRFYKIAIMVLTQLAQNALVNR